jgi:hypothetical protein
MHSLEIGPDWTKAIAEIRDAHTQDTNLIRFDNACYRVCEHDPGTFTVMLEAPSSKVPLALTIRAEDLYVTHVGGMPFERYPSTLNTLKTESPGIVGAIHDVAKGNVSGPPAFLLKGLLVFCVAESIRSDRIAQAVGDIIKTGSGKLLGAPKLLEVAKYVDLAHTWGNSSDAIVSALSREGREALTKPISQLTAAQRWHTERVDLTKIPPQFQDFAKQVKVLKRPR